MRKKYYLFSIVIVVVLAFSLYFYQRQRTNFFNYSVRDMQPRVYYEIDGPIIVGYEKELAQDGTESEFKQVQKLFSSLKENDFTETREIKKRISAFRAEIRRPQFLFPQSGNYSQRSTKLGRQEHKKN